MKLELHLEIWFGLFRPKEWSEDHSPVVASRAKYQRQALRQYLIFIRLWKILDNHVYKQNIDKSSFYFLLIIETNLVFIGSKVPVPTTSLFIFHVSLLGDWVLLYVE